jgi:MFS family permease
MAIGIGTALVYPTFLALTADGVAPAQRAESLGVFRFWRDMGYALGALVSGLAADMLGMTWAVGLVGALTLASAFAARVRMRR